MFCYVPTCFLFSSSSFYIGGHLKEEKCFCIITAVFLVCRFTSALTLEKQSPKRCSVKKEFLKILQNSQENICASLFFNKVTGLRPSTLLKKRFQRKCFPVNFAKFTRTTFLKEHLWWLFLTLFRIGFFGAAHG